MFISYKTATCTERPERKNDAGYKYRGKSICLPLRAVSESQDAAAAVPRQQGELATATSRFHLLAWAEAHHLSLSYEIKQ